MRRSTTRVVHPQPGESRIAQTRGVVGVLGAVDSGQQYSPRPGPASAHDRRGVRATRSHLGSTSVASSPDDDGARLETLGRQVLGARTSGGSSRSAACRSGQLISLRASPGRAQATSRWAGHRRATTADSAPASVSSCPRGARTQSRCRDQHGVQRSGEHRPSLRAVGARAHAHMDVGAPMPRSRKNTSEASGRSAGPCARRLADSRRTGGRRRQGLVTNCGRAPTTERTS